MGALPASGACLSGGVLRHGSGRSLPGVPPKRPRDALGSFPGICLSLEVFPVRHPGRGRLSPRLPDVMGGVDGGVRPTICRQVMRRDLGGGSL